MTGNNIRGNLKGSTRSHTSQYWQNSRSESSKVISIFAWPKGACYTIQLEIYQQYPCLGIPICLFTLYLLTTQSCPIIFRCHLDEGFAGKHADSCVLAQSVMSTWYVYMNPQFSTYRRLGAQAWASSLQSEEFFSFRTSSDFLN